MKKTLLLLSMLPSFCFAQKHELNLFLLGDETSKVKYDYSNPTSKFDAHYDDNSRKVRYALGYNYITAKNTELGISLGMGTDKSDSKVQNIDDIYSQMQYDKYTQKWYYAALSFGKRFEFHKLLLHVNLSVPFELKHFSDYIYGAGDQTYSSGSTPHTQDVTVTMPNTMVFGIATNSYVSYPIVKHLYVSAGLSIAQKWSRAKGTSVATIVENYQGNVYRSTATQETMERSSTLSVNPNLGLRLIF